MGLRRRRPACGRCLPTPRRTGWPPPRTPPPPPTSPKPTPVSAKPSLACSPVLTLLNSSVRMPQVRSADPPKEEHGSKAGQERDPEPERLEIPMRSRADTHFLRWRGQGHNRSIQSLSKVSMFDRRMEVFAPDLIHDRGGNDRQHLTPQRHRGLPFLHCH